MTKLVIIRAVVNLAKQTRNAWDDVVLRHRILHRLSQIAPGFVFYSLAIPLVTEWPQFAFLLRQAGLIYMLLVGAFVLDVALNLVVEIINSSPTAREFPVRSVVQVIKLVLFGLAAIAIFSVLLGKSPVLLFSGLGAMTAIIMLVFKDPILGFVAGIQLSANRMVARGDWIEMPKHGADGDVLEVGLTTVKIQNWDKTITTIPTYALITESFKNWRGMTAADGRRIKRALNIDTQSVRFCDSEMLTRFQRIQYVSDYVKDKLAEITEWNTAHGIASSDPLNARRLTNIGTFRAYIVSYLRNHSMINDEMTFLVRQLDLTPQGLPIEIYVFSRDKEWNTYEDLQADIFDHLLAIAPEFDLRIYQSPSSADLRTFAPPPAN